MPSTPQTEADYQNPALPALIELLELKIASENYEVFLINEYNLDHPEGKFQWSYDDFVPAWDWYPFPFSINGFEQSREGTLPRVSLELSNIRPFPFFFNNGEFNQQIISQLAFRFDDLLKSEVNRYQVWREDLDNNNPSFIQDRYFIIGKESETKSSFTFTLGSPLDIPSVQIPSKNLNKSEFPAIVRVD
ncbi:UNVERIFIED_CONTAM: hypothetical protein BEN50_14400 [Euhalothece sp. KZN 001]